MDEKRDKAAGGLYRHVKVSVKTVNIVIAVAVLALVVVMVIVVNNNGFVINFDTDGGSYIAPVRGYYGELLTEPAAPVREGYVFTGWYLDRALKNKWNFSEETLTGDVTLYAGWDTK